MNDGAMNALAQQQPPFAQFLGMKITMVSPERVTAELPARPDLNNRFGIMHGGAIMALADNLGGTATMANLKPGQSTTTVESKSNFFAAIPIGNIAKAECTPLHRGGFDPVPPSPRLPPSLELWRASRGRKEIQYSWAWIRTGGHLRARRRRTL